MTGERFYQLKSEFENWPWPSEGMNIMGQELIAEIERLRQFELLVPIAKSAISRYLNLPHDCLASDAAKAREALWALLDTLEILDLD